MGYKIVGFPVRIDNPRYARNAYYFNLCFVCDDWARTVQYEPIVKKLAEYLIMMEEESEFLSKEHNKIERIQNFLNKIRLDLNEKKVSTVVGKFFFFSYHIYAYFIITLILLKILNRG